MLPALNFLQMKIFQDYDTDDLVDFEETILKGCDIDRNGEVSKKAKIHLNKKISGIMFNIKSKKTNQDKCLHIETFSNVSKNISTIVSKRSLSFEI